jgi:glucose uptake protein GlcU
MGTPVLETTRLDTSLSVIVACEVCSRGSNVSGHQSTIRHVTIHIYPVIIALVCQERNTVENLTVYVISILYWLFSLRTQFSNIICAPSSPRRPIIILFKDAASTSEVTGVE